MDYQQSFITGPGLSSLAGDSVTGHAIAPQAVPNQNRIKSINIRQLDRGYIVEVGCQIIAITNKTELIAVFAEYINNPLATEQKHMEGKLFV